MLTADEQLLKSANVPLAGSALLEFFHKRTSTEAAPEVMEDLVRKLGAPSSEERNRAFGELVSWGAVAVSELRRAANNLDDLEAVGRARQCLALIEPGAGSALTQAAVRVLGQFKPAGATEALLAYLPFADDDEVIKEIAASLARVAFPHGKAEAALVQALHDPVPIRRGVAAEVLGKRKGMAETVRVVPLMKDPKPTVRLRAALGLAENYHGGAIPVLIDLLAELPDIQRQQAEEYLVQMAGEWSVVTPPGNEPVLRDVRRAIWAAWWKATEQLDLLKEFRQRTLSEAEREKAEDLIQKLGQADVKVRDEAAAALHQMGTRVVPLLRRATEIAEPPVAAAAGQFLLGLDANAAPKLPGVLPRLVAFQKPRGAAEAMLAYIPFAESGADFEEVRAALGAVALRDGKAEPVLVQALRDKVASRRAAAAEALCRAGRAEPRDEVRRLLKDPDLNVRLRTALALVTAQDKQSVPALIALLEELPPGQSWSAEECLIQLAGDKSPGGAESLDAESRKKHRQAWTDWWTKNQTKVDLGRLELSQRTLGYTLVVEQYDHNKRSNRVLELDAAGRIRWQIDGLQYAMDAQSLAGNRVLIAEQSASRVTERDYQGNILWQKSVGNPFACERLRNGNTFIACRHQLLEVDRDGKDVFTHSRPQGDIASARRWPDGQIVFVTYQGAFIRLDATGKEQKNVTASFLVNFAHAVDFLANDHVLVAMYNSNKVTEYDLTGKIAWEFNMPTPSAASRLPNGHTLVVNMGSQRIVEVDRAGRTITEYKENLRPWKARRR
jgi:HEAT repeat protein